MNFMKNSHFKKLLLSSIFIACLGMITAHTGWASTKNQQKNTNAQKTSKVTKTKKSFRRGEATHSHQTLEEIHRLGKTELDHVTVQGRTQVLGRCKIKNSQLNTLKVRGRTNITHTNIQGAAFVQGMTEIANSQLHQLKVQGKLCISESVVKGKFKAQGQFQAIHTDFLGQVHTMGHFRAQNAVFQQEVHLIGNMHVDQTSFASTLTAVTQEIILHDTTTQDLYIKDNNTNEIEKWSKKYKFLSFLADKQDEPQVVTLSGKTIIQGSITFENGKGIVVLGKEAQIKGEVIGGTIKQL
jgi:hypothetical protein